MLDLIQFASALIEVFEGRRLTAYRDNGGVWTIGVGHAHGVHEGMICTREQADTWFAQDQAQLLIAVKDRPLMEAAALVSFGFNCGLNALRAYLDGTLQLEARIHDRKGNVEPGLVARRRLEAMLIQVSRQDAAARA